MEDVKFIYGDRTDDFFNYAVKNVFCVNCRQSYNSEIVNYSIFLNDLNDLVQSGFCKECGHTAGRYIETGERPELVSKIEALWILRKFAK